MKKEVLTKARIQKDLKVDIFKSLWSGPLACFALFLFLSIFRWILKSIYANVFLFNILVAIPILLMLIVFFCDLIRLLKVSRGDFWIAKDILIKRKEYSPGMGIWSSYKPYMLHFSTYGCFKLLQGKQYTWSNQFCMSEHDLYDYSSIGEHFIVAGVRYGKILKIYNQNMFDYIGEIDKQDT